MCGIAGVYRLDEGRADLGRLHLMSRLLRHRGPDDEGMVLIPRTGDEAVALGGPDTPLEVYRSELPWAPGRSHHLAGGDYPLALASRRLSIVDLSPGGHQPMCDPLTGNWVVYNGEIYNHVELRRELEGRGCALRTGSDTEVLLAAYREWGRDCLARLNGMWGFALWDARLSELFCARDRLGVKPFYYQWDGDLFAFASEPKALVLTQARPVRADEVLIHALLALDWVDFSPRTFFAETTQLMPGHWLVVAPGRFQLERYWSLEAGRRVPDRSAGWADRFLELFGHATRLRLRADVEVGSCLSGGLDSSAVVCTAAAMHPRALHTFTCAYEEGPRFDERPFVQAVTERVAARSHVVLPDGRDFFEVLERLTYEQDEPAAGAGLYSQWKVMELAHDHGLKVLLDGQGGDETLAGYHRYYLPRLRDLLTQGRLGEFARDLPRVASRIGWKTALAGLVEPLLPRQFFLRLKRSYGAGKDRVLTAAFRGAHRVPAAARPEGGRSALWEQLAFDVERRLLPSLLRYEDRNSMAFSIETRLPFLDYRLVEFLFSLPDDEKIQGVTTKALARRAFHDRLPPAVLGRSEKMGFETPMDHWLRARFARDVRDRLLRPSPLHDYLDRHRLSEELERYLEGRRDIGLQVWRWLNLEAWLRRFVWRDPRVRSAPDLPARAGAHRSFAEVAAERG